MFQRKMGMKKLSLIVSLFCISSIAFAQSQTSRIDKTLTIYTDVMRQLDMAYVDTLNYELLLETGINSMLKKVDPYTVYYPKQQNEDLKRLTTGKYGGIGALIMQRDNYVFIADPYEGMPAQKNGIQAGDKILEVDGWQAKDKTTSEVSQHLRGIPNSIIKLRLEREGVEKPFIIEFKREEIHLATVEYSGVVAPKIGYILFSEFTEHSADEFQLALSELVNKHNIEKLIIDLRGNGGGLIDEAVKIINLFVEKNTEVVSTLGKDESNKRVYKTISEPKYKDMPLVILVNEQTASAAEILAGTMQDLDRAIIVGTRTYGKGLVQNIRPIAFDGHLKVTTAKYYIPSGRCIQAIDYSRRRKDGSVEHVPDSLTHEFKTKNGRIVKDGGGISPDILSADTADKVNICYSLYKKNMFFDYATRFHLTTPSIPPATTFEITDSIMADFEQFLKEKDFTYETETSKYFKDMLDMAHHEDIDSTALKQLEQFSHLLNPSFHDAISRQREAVAEQLGAEIISRYFYQRGRTCYLLRTDKELKQAIDAFNITL